jgi:hypothetical protein
VLLADTSIKCGNLFVPYRGLEEAVARYVRALIFENDIPEYLYSRSGSCTLLAYKEAQYCFLTKHQVGTFDLNNAKIVKSGFGGEVFALDTRWDVTPENQEEYEDILAMKVTPSSVPSFDFFDLSNNSPPSIRDSKLLIAVGCPTSLSEIKYDPHSVHIKTVTIPAQYQKPFDNAAHFHTMKLLSNQESPDFSNFNLDGMSGGAIFSIDGELRNYQCSFRGIITRGGNGFIHFIDTDFVTIMLRKIA